MRRLAAALILGLGGLLLTPGAAGGPEASASLDIQVDIAGTLGTNSWHLSNVTVRWIVTGETWHNCTTQTLSAETPGQRIECAARNDNTGEEAFKSVTIKIDKTNPTATPSPSPQPNQHGWHRAPVTVTFVAADAMSGPDQTSCTVQGYSSADTHGHNITGTCKDRAGNTSAPSTYTVKYDATKPTATHSLSQQPNPNGWHRTPVSVSFSGSDATSGLDPASCTAPQRYERPDTQGHVISGTCKDLAGNTSDPSAYTVKYDATKPTAAPSPSPQPNQHGWHRAPLTVTFVGADATSGPDQASCTVQGYSGGDTAAHNVTGTCKDLAGNTSDPSTYTVKYDATKPTAAPSPSPQPNQHGWHRAPVTVTFVGADAMSGPDQNSCAVHGYSGGDTAGHNVTGTCKDLAGNSSDPSVYTVRYDATAPSIGGATPSREPDRNGWYNHALTVSFSGSDSLSGVASCAERTYSTPDSANASVSGTCTDRAGNASGTGTFGFKFDATKPQVTDKIPSRPPNADGWYKEPLTVEFRGTDSLSGIASCAKPTYSGPESATASISGTCLDAAGNESLQSAFAFKYDATGPQVIPSPARGPDSNGWYNRPVSISFGGSDAASGLASCGARQTYEGPDSVLAVITGTCLDKAGNVGLGSMALKYDATAPQVGGASPDRAPDANGWYNHPVAISFYGADATSDIDGCTVAGYGGPDNPTASVLGSCRDRAGNESGSNAFALKFDATPPALTGVSAKPGNASSVVSWTPSADTTLVEVRRAGAVVYRGTGRTFTDTGLRNGVRYRYTVTAYDEAQNAARAEVTATPTAPLLSPAAGATVSAPPRLAWKSVENATYYNVQVWRRGKIFSAWPTSTSIRLKRTWTYEGRRYRLTPGRYRWYVWPGFGRRAKNKYGRLLGSSTFVVR